METQTGVTKMMTKKQAEAYAARMANLHGSPWLVFKTPDNAACNEHPANIYNSGRYATCPASERADYEAGGAQFLA
jgi:hypothetical protein